MPSDFLHTLFASILPIEIEMALSVIALLGFSAWMLKGLWQQKDSKSTLLVIISVLAVAFLLRLSWIFSTQPLPHSDFQVYWDYAHRFYHGDFRFDVIERHPGIILLYTLGFYILGDSLWAGWTINLFFSVLFLLTLYSLSLELFGKRVALCTLVLGSFLPTAISYTAIMASETPAVTYMMMAIWAALRLRKLTLENKGKASLCVALGLGCLLFGSTLIRSTSLLLPVLFCLSIVIFRGAEWKKSFALMLGSSTICGILVGGWIAHQAIITGILKLFFGEELWLVFASNYQHQGRIFPMEQIPCYSSYIKTIGNGDVASRIRAYKVLGDYSWQVIKGDPLKYLAFGLTRMRGILWFSQSGIVWSIKNSLIGFALPVRMRLLTEISNTCWRVLLILSAMTWVMPWPAHTLQNEALNNPRKDNNREIHLVISLFIVCWLIFHFLMSVVSERYAFQLLPFILMYSAKGGVRLVEWVANTVKNSA
jgi:hypothetical protein